MADRPNKITEADLRAALERCRKLREEYDRAQDELYALQERFMAQGDSE